MKFEKDSGYVCKRVTTRTSKNCGIFFLYFFFLHFDYSSHYTYLGEMLPCCLKFLDYICEHNIVPEHSME